MAQTGPGITDAAIHGRAASSDEYVFLSPEWLHEVARAVQSAKEADLYFRGLVAGISLKLVYIIRDVPEPLRYRLGGGDQMVVSVRLARGTIRKLEIGGALPEEEFQLIVTIEYAMAKKLFLGEANMATTILNRRVRAEPVNGFRGWPKLAAKSLVTASRILRVARKVPTIFEPCEPAGAAG